MSTRCEPIIQQLIVLAADRLADIYHLHTYIYADKGEHVKTQDYCHKFIVSCELEGTNYISFKQFIG